MSASDRRVIALGNLAGELKASLEAAVRAAELELLLTREPARAFIELERDGAVAMLVDIATLGAEQFCKRARGTERLRSVPVIGMSRHPNELGFARVFAWGADDLVPLGAVEPLERRLRVLCATQRPETAGFGQAVVAEATTQRRALVGRVLSHAGYDVKFAVDRGAVELYASQAETRLVVISAALGDPRRIIEAAARAGALPTWIVTAEERSVARLASSLSGLDRVAVTSTSGSPEDVLFLANELVFGKGTRRREWRALYATPVAFRARGEAADEYGFSYDASPGGLYVRSLLPCEAEEVEVELRLPNRDERVRLTGKVARRFAFGSGAIASAPPGFSVKLEGPAGALERWADACQQLIKGASDAFSNPPPARSSSESGAAPLAGSGLAVPPATLTIESVVAPLPKAVLEDVEKGTDVGELLAATLDEQTLALVGTKPVTMDAETLDVREERPSEIAMRLPSELLEEAAAAAASVAPPVPSVPDSQPRLPLPAPQSSPGNALGKHAAASAPPEQKLVDPRFDWESDAETAVRQSRPDTEGPPTLRQSRPDTEAAAGRSSRPDVEEQGPPVSKPAATREEPTPAREQPAPPREEPTSAREQPAPPREEPAPTPEPAAQARKEPSPAPPPAQAAPNAAAPRPAPPVPPRNTRATMIGVAPPAVGSAPAAQGLGKTQVLPPPRAKAPSSPGISDPLAAPPVAPAPKSSPKAAEPEATAPRPPDAAPAAEPPPAPASPAPAQPTPAQPTPARQETAPFEPVPRAFGEAATVLAGSAFIPPASTDRAAASAGASPADPARTESTAEARPIPRAAPRIAPARAEPPSGGSKAWLVVLIALMALGGLALLLLPKGGSAPSATPATDEQPSTAATTTPPSEATAVEPPAADTSATPTGASSPAAPEPTETAPAAAAPAASAAPATGSAPAPSVAAAPDHPPIEFDLRKLAADRAVLYVRSSAQARVFVHGTDYGETNSVLVTSCGIRFVRLGRSLGDFVEPGGSYVIKCGRINEITIEPVP